MGKEFQKFLFLKQNSKGMVFKSLLKPTNGKRQTSVCLFGDVPPLYAGMVIGLDLNGKEILDYQILFGEKTRAVLEKNGVCIDEYIRKVNMHKRLRDKGFTWNKLDLKSGEMYALMPFAEADKLHKAVFDNKEDIARGRAMVAELLKRERDKKNRIEFSVKDYMNDFYRLEAEGAYDPLHAYLKIAYLKSRCGFEENKLYDIKYREMAEFVDKDIRSRLNSAFGLVPKEDIKKYISSAKAKDLCEEQKNVLYCLEDDAPCIITGGPGVGKTTVIKAVIGCYKENIKKSQVLLVAPTGKAARRLAEKTGMITTTIHSAIRKTPADAYVYHNKSNPLPHDLIVVDESSMINLELMNDLLNSLKFGAKIIFVGDHEQLKPVGYGEPFFDFMKMEKMKVFFLKENHRQGEGSDILEMARRAVKGLPIESGNGITVREISYSEILSHLPENSDDITSVQIISPLNATNKVINSHLKKGKGNFNVGDKIMTLKNREFYSNGDIGEVLSVSIDGVEILINRKAVTIPSEKLDELTLAYSITVHKMQGSEAEKVVVFMPKNSFICDPRMMNTAISRAKKELDFYYYEEDEPAPYFEEEFFE
jgi:RecD/TraA family predicted helicase